MEPRCRGLGGKPKRVIDQTEGNPRKRVFMGLERTENEKERKKQSPLQPPRANEKKIPSEVGEGRKTDEKLVETAPMGPKNLREGAN